MVLKKQFKNLLLPSLVEVGLQKELRMTIQPLQLKELKETTPLFPFLFILEKITLFPLNVGGLVMSKCVARSFSKRDVTPFLRLTPMFLLTLKTPAKKWL